MQTDNRVSLRLRYGALPDGQRLLDRVRWVCAVGLVKPDAAFVDSYFKQWLDDQGAGLATFTEDDVVEYSNWVFEQAQKLLDQPLTEKIRKLVLLYGPYPEGLGADAVPQHWEQRCWLVDAGIVSASEIIIYSRFASWCIHGPLKEFAVETSVEFLASVRMADISEYLDNHE